MDPFGGGPSDMIPDGQGPGAHDDFGLSGPSPHAPVGLIVATNTKLRPDGTVLDQNGRVIGTVRPEFGGMVVGPDGRIIGARFPDGSIRAPLAGDVVAANTVVAADGMVLGPDGRPMGKILPWNDLVVAFNGMIIGKRIPDGTVRGLRPGDMLEPNTTVHPDGTVTAPDGRVLGTLRPDGMVVKPDGHILGMRTPNGAVVVPGHGDVFHAKATVTPDGMALDADGRPLGRVMPDGTVVGPDGAIVGQMNPDGFIAAPGLPGVSLHTGTTLKAGLQFGSQVVLDRMGRVMGKLRPNTMIVVGPDGQTYIGVRGPNGTLRPATIRDLDPRRVLPKAFGRKSYSQSPSQREADMWGPLPRCCGIPTFEIAKWPKDPKCWPMLVLCSPVLIPSGLLYGMWAALGKLGTRCKGCGRSCDNTCKDPAYCGSCVLCCEPCFSACGCPDASKVGLPRFEVGCARCVDTCKSMGSMKGGCEVCSACCGCTSLGFSPATFSWPKCFQCVVQMSVGAGCLAPGRSLLALFVNTAALLWLFVYVLIEVVWNWGLNVDTSNDAFGWALRVGSEGGLSPSPDHWLLLIFAIAGIVFVVLFFMFNVFVPPPPPPRSAVQAEDARVRRRGKICTYLSLALLFLVFGAVLLYFTLATSNLATQAPEVNRLAWLILLIWAALFLLLTLLGIFICCDCAISGRMKVIVMFTDKQNAFDNSAKPSDAHVRQQDIGSKAASFIGASDADVEHMQAPNWGPPMRQPLVSPQQQQQQGYQEPLAAPRNFGSPPQQFAMDRARIV